MKTIGKKNYQKTLGELLNLEPWAITPLKIIELVEGAVCLRKENEAENIKQLERIWAVAKAVVAGIDPKVYLGIPRPDYSTQAIPDRTGYLKLATPIQCIMHMAEAPEECPNLSINQWEYLAGVFLYMYYQFEEEYLSARKDKEGLVKLPARISVPLLRLQQPNMKYYEIAEKLGCLPAIVEKYWNACLELKDYHLYESHLSREERFI